VAVRERGNIGLTPPIVGAIPPVPTSRRAPPYRRLLTALRISAWSGAWILFVVATGVLLFLHRGDPEGSARVANRELELVLERGEAIVHRVPVMQRHWWNYFRVTHGVLAATDRRVLYMGVPPEELFPHEAEPLELEEASWRYDAPVVVHRGRVFFDTRAGITLAGDRATGTFAIASRDGPKLDSVLAVMSRAQAAIRATQDAERRAAEAAAEAARQPIYHVVRRGETLEQLAQRYGAELDSLRAWNELRTDRIKVGDRLLVKRGS
jgi:LysM domain